MNEVFKTHHPLFKEINTKFLNLDSDKKFFSVGFNDSKTKLIINNNGEIKEYKVFIKTINSTELKYIHPDNIEEFDGKDKNKICRIIENDGVNDRKFFLEVELNENKKIMTIDDGNESKEYNISKKEDKKIISLLFKLIYPKNTEKLDEEIIFRIIENIELNNNKKVFSVELNNTEKIFGFKLNKNNKKFDVKLNENEKKLIITNNGETEEYEVFIKTINSRKFKCIHPDFKCIHPKNKKEFNPNEIFIIIENDDQLNSFNNKNNKNFDRCIFLEKFCPLSTSIDFQKGNPSFQYSIFKDGCNFDNIEIINSNFQDCIFFGWAYFQKSIFKYDTNKILPYRYISFSGSVFLDHADFIETKFESDTYFGDCIFKSAGFNGAEFKQYISFDNSRFIKCLKLTGSKINKMIFENTKIELLHLTGVEIKDDINCENTEIENADCRETFRILKEICIKKYDNISALYFHKKEMKQYSKDLNKKFFNKFTKYNLILNSIRNFFSSLYKNKFIKNNAKLSFIRKKFSLIYKYILGIIRIIFSLIYKYILRIIRIIFSLIYKFILGIIRIIFSLIYKFILEIIRIIEFFFDKFILFFEKIVSDYGTNPFLAILWLLLIHSIDYGIRDCRNNPCNELEVTDFNIYNLNIMEILLNLSNPSNLLKLWFLIKIILSSVLIYEIIKSFRKFSRKL